eukprot:472553-Prorocentrum_minimum.AAC.1
MTQIAEDFRQQVSVPGKRFTNHQLTVLVSIAVSRTSQDRIGRSLIGSHHLAPRYCIHFPLQRALTTKSPIPVAAQHCSVCDKSSDGGGSVEEDR